MSIFSPRFLALSFVLMLAVASVASPAYAGEKAKERAKLSASGSAFYITMTPMVLPVMDGHGIHEVVSMVVALQVKDGDNMDKVNDMVPRLNDAYLRALYGKLDGTVYRNGQFIDVNKVKTRLMGVTENVVGKGKVDEVLIQGINQRIYN